MKAQQENESQQLDQSWEIRSQRDQDALKTELLEQCQAQAKDLEQAHTRQCLHEKNELEVYKDRTCDQATAYLTDQLNAEHKDELSEQEDY